MHIWLSRAARYVQHNNYYTASACMVQITVYLNGHAVQTCTQPPRDIDVTCFFEFIMLLGLKIH